MGLFGRKKKTGSRGKNKTAKEVALKLENDFIRDLKKSTDPEDQALYRQIMNDRVGLKPKMEKDRITETIETISLLKNAGLIDDVKNAGGGGFNWKEVLSGIGELGKSMPEILSGFQGAGVQPQLAQEEPQEPAAQLPSPEQSGKVKIHMSVLSRALILKVQNPFTRKLAPPSEVADMLLSKYGDPDTKWDAVRELVDGFTATPDEGMGDFIQAFARKYPDLSGFIAWMASAERQAWFGQCIRAVQERARAAGETEAEGAEMGI